MSELANTLHQTRTRHDLHGIKQSAQPLAQNNCYGSDYDELGSILKKIEVTQGTDK